MSRHSELFDRAIRENGLAGKTISVEMHAESRSPMFKTEGRLRAEIEKVVNRIQRGCGPVAPKVVVFTAFEPASGCSWICAHSGDLLAASTDASVCLVDANLRTPTLHKRLGILNHNGFTDLIADPTLRIRSLASKLPHNGLWMLTSGSVPDDAKSCLAQSDRIRDRMAELRSCFDFVVIDAPAITVCNDALALGQAADAVVLVLRAGSTRRHLARRLTEELVASGVKVLGAILNDYNSCLPKAAEKWL
jgi:succinoglycan biosynthesis transport protein ExoP